MTDSKDKFSMGVKFRAPGDAPPWIHDDIIETALLRPLLEDGIVARCPYLSRNLGDYVQLDSIAELVEQSRTWGYDLILLASEPVDDPSCQIRFMLDEGAITIGARFGGAILASVRAHLMGMTRRWVVSWSNALPAQFRLDRGGFSHFMQSYPQPRPPRSGIGWTLGLLASYVGIRERQSTAAEAAILDRLRSDPLPEGASRHVDGDVLILEFIDSLRDPDAIVRARIAHHDWLSQIVPTEPERGWNELGDRVAIPSTPKPHDPLTLYDATDQVGYKAIVVQPDGAVDEDVWREMQSILRTHALPDGTPVRSLRLVVPRREDALLLHARAIADGFEMVMYPKGEGAFWEVNPP